MKEIVNGLQDILVSIKQLAVQYHQNGDEQIDRLEPLAILTNALSLLSRLANCYGSLEDENIRLNRYLEIVLTSIEAVYKVTKGNSSLKDVDRELTMSAARQMSGNRWFVQNVVDQFLLDHQDLKYEVSQLRSCVLNDLLWLTIRPSIQVAESTNRDIQAFYRLVRDELGHQRYPDGYVVSSRWQLIASRMIRLAGHLNNPMHTAVLGMHGSLFYAHVKQIAEAEAAGFQIQKDLIGEKYPEIALVGESKLSLPGTKLEVEGLPYSTGLSQCLDFYTEIISRMGRSTACDVIVEIGSGFGRLARLFRLSGRCRSYVLVDLPESLLFAYAFLKINFPQAAFHVVRSPKDVHPDNTRNFDFIFCPVQRFEDLRIGHVDLLINTWSFGEMQQGCVDFLLGVVQKNLKPEFLFSMNTMFMNRNLHHESSGDSGLGEGNEVVLNVMPMWWPTSFQMSSSEIVDGHGRKIYRNTAVAMLRKETSDPVSLVDRLIDESCSHVKGSTQWVQYMYFAALWAASPNVIEDFLAGLRIWMATAGTDRMGYYKFESMGEVRFFRRRQRRLMSGLKSVSLACRL